MRILIIEDEKNLALNIKKGFVENGFAVDAAYDGEEGLYLAEAESYDAIILDLMLPKLDGLSVVKSLREKKNTTPILILTAKDQLHDKVTGFESGADDYLTKPFAFEELKVRIQVLLRRKYNAPQSIVTVNTLEFDTLKHIVRRDGELIKLTPKEFAILEYLVSHKGEVVSRTQIIEHTWDYNFESLSNLVDVFIATLRKKIDSGRKIKLIHTIHGVGYKLGI